MNEYRYKRPVQSKVGNEVTSRPPATYSYVPPRQTRRLLVMRSELMRVRSERLSLVRDHMPEATKAGMRTGQVNNLSNTLAYGLLIVTILTVIAASTNFINWAFLVYGVIVLAIKLPSQRIFVAALISLVLIPLTTLLHRTSLANDFAVVAFYFLLVGLLRAIIETRTAPEVVS